jgi:hypothetical protein
LAALRSPIQLADYRLDADRGDSSDCCVDCDTVRVRVRILVPCETVEVADIINTDEPVGVPALVVPTVLFPTQLGIPMSVTMRIATQGTSFGLLVWGAPARRAPMVRKTRMHSPGVRSEPNVPFLDPSTDRSSSKSRRDIAGAGAWEIAVVATLT